MNEKMQRSFKAFIDPITGFAGKIKGSIDQDNDEVVNTQTIELSEILTRDFDHTYRILESLGSKTPTKVSTWAELVSAATNNNAYVTIVNDLKATSSLNDVIDLTIINDHVIDMNDYGIVNSTITIKGYGKIKSSTNKHAMFSHGSYIFKDVELYYNGNYPMFYKSKFSFNDNIVTNDGDAPMFYEVIGAEVNRGSFTNNGRIMFYSGGYIFNDTHVTHNSADSMFNSITAEFNGGEYVNSNSSAPMFFGTFVFNGGTFINKSLYSQMFDASHIPDEVSVFNGGEFINYAINMFTSKNNLFNGGRFVNHGSQYMFVSSHQFNGGEFVNTGNAQMFAGESSVFNGGTYINEGPSFMFIGNGSVFNAGTYINNGDGIMLSNGAFTINGGEFINNGADVIFDNTKTILRGGKIINYGESGIFHRGSVSFQGSTEIINDGFGTIFTNDVEVSISDTAKGLIFYQEETLDDGSCDWNVHEDAKTLFKVIVDNKKWIDRASHIDSLQSHLNFANKTIDKKEDTIQNLLKENYEAQTSIEALNSKLCKLESEICKYNVRANALEKQVQVKPMIILEFDTRLGASYIPIGQIMETVYVWNGSYENHVIDVLTLQGYETTLSNISYETNITELLGEGTFTVCYADPFTATYNESINEGLTRVPYFDIAGLGVTSISKMFSSAINFNDNISSWDTSTVMNMSYTFENAISYNQNISHWNVNRVTNWTGFGDEAQHLITNPDIIPARFKGLILSTPNK